MIALDYIHEKARVEHRSPGLCRVTNPQTAGRF